MGYPHYSNDCDEYHAVLRRPVLREIDAERVCQDAKWGQQNHTDGTGPYIRILARTDVNLDLDLRTCEELANIFKAKCGGNTPAQDNWRDILLEEVFEAMAEEDATALRTELIQVAAVAVSWVEAIDRREVAA